MCGPKLACVAQMWLKGFVHQKIQAVDIGEKARRLIFCLEVAHITAKVLQHMKTCASELAMIFRPTNEKLNVVATIWVRHKVWE